MIELFHTIPHEASVAYPDPQPGDVWIVEEPYWDVKRIAAAVTLQLSILLVGMNVALKEEANVIGVDSLLGNDVDPDELIRWVQGRQKERPTLRRAQKRGIMVAFAGLLPTGGGVGKDTLVINTAAWLSAQGKSVAVVDLDPFGTLKDRLKVKTTLTVDLWEARFTERPLTSETVKSALVQTLLKFWLLPASAEGKMQSEAAILHMGQWLQQAFEVVIWNLGSGSPGTSFFAALHQADHLFLIGTGDRAKFHLYQKTFEDYQAMMEIEPKILFNKFYEKDAPKFFEQDYGHPVFAYALEDRRVFELNEQGKAVALEQPRRPFGMAVQKIGKEIVGETVEDKPKKGGFRFW